MKFKLLFLALLFSVLSWGQIAAWDFTGEGSTANATSVAEVYNASLDASNLLTRGGTAAWSTGANSFRTVGFQSNGISVANTDYFQFTLSASSGNLLSLTSIDARFAGTATFANSPGVANQFAYSLDGTNFTLIGSSQLLVGSPATLTQINLSGISALQNLSDNITITIRYFASGQTNTGSWGFNSPSSGIYGLSIGGTITTCTPPINPTGVITITPNCGSTTLAYSAPNASLYWQTSATGTDTTYPTTSTYTASTGGTYYVRAYNGTCWSTGTAFQVVTVVSPVNITTQPASQSATTGTTTTFNVVAANASGYQWQVNTGSGWTNISGATTASYITPTTTLAMNGYQYQVVITGNSPCGTITSSAATLSVTTGPCGAENFNNSNATASYQDGSFVGNNGVTWTYIQSRDQNGDANGSGISGNALMLRRASDNSRVTSSSVNTGIGNFSVKLYKGFTGSGTRQVELFVNGTSMGTSIGFDDDAEHLFTVNGINIAGGVIIELRNTTGSQVIVDDITWTCYNPVGPEINITGSATDIADNDTTPSTADDTNFGTTTLSTNIVKVFTIHNQGTTDLVLNGPISVTDVTAPQEFVITQPVVTTIAAGGFTTFAVTFNSAVAGTFTNTIVIESNDTDEATYNFNIVATAYDPAASGTIFRPGDMIFVGYDSTVSAAADCSGMAQMDKLYLSNLVDILPGTEFMVVNSRYESGAAANVRTDRWYSGSTDPYDDPGIITFKWNGTTTIVAGSILTFRANVFAVSDIRINNVVTTDFGVTTNANQCNISSNDPDQIYIMQGAFTAFGTVGTSRYNTFNGSVLFGLTNGASWVPFTSSVPVGNNVASRVSRLPEDLECFNIEASSLEGVRFYENTGLHSGSKNQILGAIMNLSNWSAPTNDTCLSTTENFSPTANDNAVGKPFTVTASNPDGTWTGFTDTDWFKCSNWEGLAVPKSTTDVIIPNVAVQPVIGAVTSKFPTGAFSNHLTINSGSSLTMNNASSQLNLYGNWANNAGNANFNEGNGTVYFNGNALQTINNVAPTGTEVFYNVVLNNSFDTAASNDLIASGGLTVNAGRTLDIDTNGYVQVNGRLTDNGTITVHNDGQFIQIEETDTNMGAFTGTSFRVARTADNIRSLDYVYWSAPVEGFDVGTINGTLRYYWDTTYTNPNGTQGYWLGASGTMNKGQGYIVRGPESFATPQPLNVNFDGKPHNGQFTYTATRGTNPASNDDNLVLVGNPYPSAINANQFLAANTSNIEGAVRIWTHGDLPSTAFTDPFYENFVANYDANDYIVYNGTATTIPGAFDGDIASGQGFFVTLLETGAATKNIVFRNAMRGNAITASTLNNTQFFRNTASQQGITEKSRIWLDLVNASGQASKAVVGYVDGATMAKDNFYDAYAKLNQGMILYTLIEEEAIHIQGRALPFKDTDLVPMGMQVTAPGNYKIGIAHLDGLFSGNQMVYLEDKKLNIIHDLKANPYAFTVDNIGFVNDRFVLRYTDKTLGNEDFDTVANAVVVYGNNGLVIKSSLETIQEVIVYDVLGRTIAQKKNNAANEVILPSVAKTQSALFVKITLTSGKVIDKKILY